MAMTHYFERLRQPQERPAPHTGWIVALRVALGLVLVTLGIIFLSHSKQLEAMIQSRFTFNVSTAAIASYISFAHLLGGVLIVMGLFTRFAAIMQVPILVAAMIFENSKTGVFSIQPGLWLSIVVFLALVFFVVYGSGPYSMDRYVKRHLL